MRTMALETYKIVNKSSPEFLHNLITLKENSYNFRYKLTVNLPRPRTTRYGKKSFSYEAGKLWNSLSNHARNLSTFGNFKSFISTWCFSENCSCSSCRSQYSLLYSWLILFLPPVCFCVQPCFLCFGCFLGNNHVT